MRCCLFRMGDFYELFFDDAKTAARVLGLALTSRDKGDDPVPMAGFPHHQLDSYLAKIIAAGHRAAICEQVEDPKLAKGLVKREVTRIVTPGTLTDDALLDPQASNFLAAIVLAAGTKPTAPLAGIGLGRCLDRPVLCRRVSARAACRPAWPASSRPNCLVSDEAATAARAIGRTASRSRAGRRGRSAARRRSKRSPSISARTRSKASASTPKRTRPMAALRAAGAILDYLAETQKASLAHIDRLMPYSSRRAAGDRPGHAPQPGDRRHDPRRPRAKARCLGTLDRTVTSPRRTAAGRLAGRAAHRRGRDQRAARCGRRIRRRRRAHGPTARIAAADLRHPAAAGPRDHRPGQPARSVVRRPHARLLAEGQGEAHRPRERAAAARSKAASTCAPTSAARSNRRSSTTARSRPATAASSAPAIAPTWTSCAS